MKVLNPILWILQVLTGLLFLYSGYLKLFTPIAQQAAMYPWTGQVAPAFLRFTGIVDLLGGIGILIPFLSISIYAASGMVLLMISASVFHISRGESSVIGFNIAIALVAAFIVWGRKRLA